MDLFQWFVLLPLPLLLTVCCINVAATCTSDLGCSLNGECAGDSCTCFDGWHGDECELLSLGPAPLGGAYGYKPNSSSWGAHVVKWKGQYNMFVSELWGGCGITSWRQNSHVVRATSDTPLGPYRYADTALPPEATCNHVLVNGSRIVLYHQFTSGAGNGNLTKCDPNWQPPTSETWTPVKPHKVHFSDTGPAGPWLAGGGDMPPGFICNNPAPLLLPNGSVAVFCHGPGIRLAVSDPSGHRWSNVTFIQAPMGGPAPHTVWEDPFAWLDKNGHWHLMSHVYPTNTSNWLQYADIVAGHGFSKDGIAWTWHPTPPYSADVTDTTGRTLHYATRERPFLLLSDDIQKSPLALFTAVTMPGRPKQNKSAGGDYSFTHVQPVVK
eukprot:COSAG02_NODE_3259_length_7079_cov_30.942693_3_plen_381_part_00